MVVIRLALGGAKKRPFYNLLAVSYTHLIQNVAGVLVAASPVGSIKSTEFSAHATIKLISLDVNDAGWAHPRRIAEK